MTQQKRTAREVASRAVISLLAADRITDLAGDHHTDITNVKRGNLEEFDGDTYAEDFYFITLASGQEFGVRYIVTEFREW